MNTTTVISKKNSTKSTPSKKDTRITEQHIRQKAFEIYLERGAEPGHEEEDWHRAEKELKN